MTVVETTRRYESHPVREAVDTARHMPGLGVTAMREFFTVFTHGNLPVQPLASHGDHLPSEPFDDGTSGDKNPPVPPAPEYPEAEH